MDSRNVSSFFKEEDGATSIEYGLIASLIAVVIIAAIGGVGEQMSAIFGNNEGSIGGAIDSVMNSRD